LVDQGGMAELIVSCKLKSLCSTVTPVQNITDAQLKVKRDWINHIMSKPWGVSLRFSVHLRRKLGREPRRDEVERATANFKKDDSVDVTAEEMMEAFNKGEESIRISGLNCEYYDIDLQREFIEKQSEWLKGEKASRFAKSELDKASKPKKKRKAWDIGGDVRKRTKIRRSRERSLSVKDEVSEYDADRTPPPAQTHKVISSRKTGRPQRAVQDIRVV